MGKHAKGGDHANDQTATDSGHVGKHRAPDPVYEVRTPAEQAAWIEQQRQGKSK
jgi:hypothetical protein